MDRNIFNNIPMDINHTVTREDRNSDEFKPVAKLIESLFDKIKEEIPMISIDLRSFDNEEEYHESYICKPIIRKGERYIIFGCFSCIEYYRKLPRLNGVGLIFFDQDPNGGFPQIGQIQFDTSSANNDINHRIIDTAVDVFKTFLYSGEIKHTYISKDEISE